MDLSRLMKTNVAEVGEVQYAPSPRITDETGQPLLWKIRPLTNALIDAINERHAIRKTDPRTGNATVASYDTVGIGNDLILESLVEPSRADLENADLLDSWGVHTPFDVLNKMLLPGELKKLFERVQSLCGMEAEVFAETIETIKKN